MTDAEKAESLWGNTDWNPIRRVSRIADEVTVEFNREPPDFDVTLLCAMWAPKSMRIEVDAGGGGCDSCGYGGDLDTVEIILSGCRL